MKTRPRIILLALLIVYLLIEGMSWTGLLLLEKVAHTSYKPNQAILSGLQKELLTQFLERGQGKRVHQEPDLGWLNVSEANSAGMRDDREYTVEPPPGILRIAAFGDSFTYGSDVELHESWAKQIPALEPSIEVLNYGMGAYGLDQAYLRYSKVAADYRTRAVFIGYMAENIGRHVNVFRGFYTDQYPSTIFTKPRFLVEDDRLVLLKNPLATLDDYERFLHHDKEVLAELGKNDYHYQTHYNGGPLDFSPAVRLAKMSWSRLSRQVFHSHYLKPDSTYNPESEAFKVTVGILDAFYGDVKESGAMPIILVFPELRDQHRSREGRPVTYEALLEDFRSKGYRYIDLQEAIRPYESQYSIGDLTRNWGHFSPVGSKIIAEYIIGKLKAWKLAESLASSQ